MTTESLTQTPVNLKDLFASVQLPGLPQTAIQLIELSQDPSNGPNEFAVPIEADPGITGQVLRFVNSSYFGFSREISTVRLAVTLVGARTIKNFVLWSAVFGLMPNPKCPGFDLRLLRTDALRRGLFARAMAKVMGLADAEEAFAAGLLQDVVVPLLAKHLPNDYNELFEARKRDKARLSDLESERFGWNHADAAGILAEKWNLPASLSSLIVSHCEIEELIGKAKTHPAELSVAMSALLPAAVDSTWEEAKLLSEAYRIVRPDNASDFPNLLEQVDREFVEFAPVLKMPLPAKNLTKLWNEFSQAAAAT